MKVFITGTDTHVGKTLISSWLCLHTGFPYFKPIQTGLKEDRDTSMVHELSGVKTYREIYAYQAPLSPHRAAKLENDTIEIEKIVCPLETSIIIEGAGGLLVPLNEKYLMIDLIQQLNIPVILVTRTTLGTINHTLLSLESLRARHIPVLGVIMNGEENQSNKEAIEWYGRTSVLMTFPIVRKINSQELKKVPLPKSLQLKGNSCF